MKMSFGFGQSNPASSSFVFGQGYTTSSSTVFGNSQNIEKTRTYTGKVQEKCTRVAVEWKVDSFRKQYHLEKWTLNSPLFCLADKKWYISLQKNGKDEKENTSQNIRIYLKVECSTSFAMCRVEYRIGIKKTDGTIYRCTENIGTFSDNQSGCPWFLDHNDYAHNEDSILNKNMLTVFCEASVIEKCDVEKRHQMVSLKALGQNLKYILLSGKNCDVKIKVKEEIFDAHRIIIESRSPVFAAMFQYDMTEKASGIVDVADCEPEIFQQFLLFLYSGEVEELSDTNVIGLYKMAEKYMMKDLKTQCVEFMRRQMSVDMICDVILLVETHQETELQNDAINFFIKNAKAILPSMKWRCFITQYPILANELFIKTLNAN